MSKWRLTLNARFPTQAVADQAKALLDSTVVSGSLFKVDRTTVFMDDEDRVWLLVDARYTTEVARNLRRTAVTSLVSTNPILSQRLEATLSWHRCTHDDLSVKDCRTTEYAEMAL